MSTTRLSAEHRRAQIVGTARELSRGGRLYDWTLETIAQHLNITTNAVRYYFYSAVSLRNEIIYAAVRERDVGIVTQALAKYDPLVHEAPADLREACGQFMAAGGDRAA